MERSSPCAALQPSLQQFGHWGYGKDLPSTTLFGGEDPNFDYHGFNFKNMSMDKSLSNYFNMKPVRGSSPTSSLAADLSQNFHIDKSPALPTPRRSLFSTRLLTSFNGRDAMMTPPLLSSSPGGPSSDSMDISPLHHKLPFAVASSIPLGSPTPDTTPTTGGPLSSPTFGPELPKEPTVAPAPIERKRPAMLRPNLSRLRGYSNFVSSTKSAGLEAQLPPFKFGSGPLTGPPFGPTTLASLEECFVESPQQTSFANPSPTVMGPPRPRAALSTSNVNGRGCVPTFLRKPSSPVQRPRKQFRRSLSMFEHPGEMIKPQKIECNLQSIMDIDDPVQLQLPHFFPSDESIPRITKETMISVLDGDYKERFDQSFIIDCRFEYEFEGGHIEGAVNYNNKEELAKKLLISGSNEKTLLVFHCEYSAHRAPIAAKYLRHEDRAANVHRYPNLTFPEVYILDGGYSTFFKDYRIRCFPQNYVEMNDKEHIAACERGLGRIKQQRTKLNRAKTFAFGQHSLALDDSPTATRGDCGDLATSMDLIDQRFDTKRFHTRRMASY
ncbi:MAG: cell division cycle- protein [Icmadophila ericetorum]|nr:cell division cycle- protein [Icmadophila ericetorum]